MAHVEQRSSMERVAPEDPAPGDAPEPAAELERIRLELWDTQARLRHALESLEESERSVRSGKVREEQLERELQHRVRNMLAVIRSVFSRTVETRTSLQDASDHFRGRLDTLARYQADAVFGPDRQHDVENMMRDEFLSAGLINDERIVIYGPTASLDGRAAESFALALHELVTNSIKFGVLSPGNTRGTLHVKWQCAEGRLRFNWIESGISIIAPAPLRRGFGREFIEESLPYQIDAQASVQITPGRISWLIDLPLNQ